MAVILPPLIEGTNPSYLLQSARFAQPEIPSVVYEQVLRAYAARFLPWQKLIEGFFVGAGGGLEMGAELKRRRELLNMGSQEAPRSLPSLPPLLPDMGQSNMSPRFSLLPETPKPPALTLMPELYMVP